MENKKTLKFDRKQLLMFAAIIAILATFMMFFRAVHWSSSEMSDKNNPSFFQLAFGISPFEDRKAGFTAIFVIQCLVIISSALTILASFNIWLSEETAAIFAIISAVLSFVLMIMSFCSVPLCGGYHGLIADEAYLGFGAILFSCFHIISIGVTAYALIKR